MATAGFLQGMERMFLPAVLDEDFRKLLLTDRANALKNSETPLTDSEHNPPNHKSYGGA